MEKIKVAGYYPLSVLIGLLLVCCVVMSNAQTIISGMSDKTLISKLKTAKSRTLPYGLTMVSGSFTSKVESASLTKKVDVLNADLFADYEDLQRIKLRIALPLQQLLLKSGANTNKIIKVYQGPVEFRVLRLTKGASFDLYSLMASEQLDCNNCEYGLSQTVNILVTTSKGHIVDHMTGAFNFGNDLSYAHRYLYVDALKRIYTVDLVSDEEAADLRDLQSWSIDSSGHFIKNNL